MRDPEVTSKIMSAVRGKNTAPELMVRTRLWALGYRYRVHHKIFGRPDLTFLGPRVAVFVDGDFWHGNAHKLRGLDSLEDLFPTRTEWWVNKLQKNMERDAVVTAELKTRGWRVLRIWSSQVLKHPDVVVNQIAREVDARS